ncbi:MAG: thrombospondin type 3 repeat-containing protein, partial [Opitutales bacterium]|nr:thrombospondin type 3 repeat-containing protein [Opitutales bacterium]
KDTDGDGVSDFWEFALGTDPERVGVPGADDKYTPNFADPLTFRNTSESPTDLSKPTLNSNLGRMNAAGRLTGVQGIQSFPATDGLGP